MYSSVDREIMPLSNSMLKLCNLTSQEHIQTGFHTALRWKIRSTFKYCCISKSFIMVNSFEIKMTQLEL